MFGRSALVVGGAPCPAALSEDTDVDVPIEDGAWPHFGPVELSGSHNPAMDTARLYFGTIVRYRPRLKRRASR